jgi:DNA-binding PadR family transcriptional regulator
MHGPDEGSWEGGWPQWGPPGGRGRRGPGWGGPPFGGPGGHRPGPPPWIRDLIRSFGGPEFGPPRRPRARRGDVRAAILDVLGEESMNGYQIIQEISERSGGAWKPSPGSVYPTIQQLEDEGLVEGRASEGRRLLHLTDEGRRYVEAHPDEMAATWEDFSTDRESAHHGPGHGAEFQRVIGQVMGAVWQVMVSGTEQQRAEAADILGDTRRRLYGLLAEDDEPETDDEEGPAPHAP